MDSVIEQIRKSIEYKEEILNDRELLNNISISAEKILEAFKLNKKVLLFGNGGSAADAQHIAAEFVSKFRKERLALPALALTTNSSILTAIGNDYEYSKIFERQVEAFTNSGDILIGISTSGNSKNVVNALKKGLTLGGFTIALVGNGGGEALAYANLALIIKGHDTPRIQEAHIMIGHIICDLVENAIVLS